MGKVSHLLLDSLGNEDGIHHREFLLKVSQKSFFGMSEHYKTALFILKQELKSFEKMEWYFCLEILLVFLLKVDAQCTVRRVDQ